MTTEISKSRDKIFLIVYNCKIKWIRLLTERINLVGGDSKKSIDALKIGPVWTTHEKWWIRHEKVLMSEKY